MNKLIAIFALLLSTTLFADQRFETVGGFCHFVTPEGFETANDDNEVFFANCINSIRQNADATGNGTTIIDITYPDGSAPFTDSYSTSGSTTGVDCVMVDSNGTIYTTQDWDSTYTYFPGKKDKDDDDEKSGKLKHLNSIQYSLTCRNGQQQ